MIAETLLAVWLIVCIYVPLLFALTREPSTEVRRVTNALIRQRAQLLSATEPAVLRIRPVSHVIIPDTNGDLVLTDVRGASEIGVPDGGTMRIKPGQRIPVPARLQERAA